MSYKRVSLEQVARSTRDEVMTEDCFWLDDWGNKVGIDFGVHKSDAEVVLHIYRSLGKYYFEAHLSKGNLHDINVAAELLAEYLTDGLRHGDGGRFDRQDAINRLHGKRIGSLIAPFFYGVLIPALGDATHNWETHMRKNHIKFKPAFDESDVFLAVVTALIVGMLLGGYATLFYGLEKANGYGKASGATYVANELAKVNAKLGNNK